MKYTDYLKKSGMSNNEVIAALQPHFPKFTKIQCSMLTHPEQYGIELSAKARKLLPPLPSKPKPKRTKPNCLTVRLDDATCDRVKIKMAQEGSESIQSFLEKMISQITKEDE